MLNHIVVMGRLTRDPELRRTGSGIPVASFTVAVDRDFGKNENGEKETDFIDCVAWRQTGEFVSKYFSKGSMAVVSGQLQIRSWTDKDGNKRRTAEIVASNVYFGESKKDSGGYGTPNTHSGFQGQAYPPQQAGYNPGSYARQITAPQQNNNQYQQQGFGGYQQNAYPAQNYQPPQVPWAPIDGDDEPLPF